MTGKNYWDFGNSLAALKSEFGDRIIPDKSLCNLNTFGTGGHARLFMEVERTEELANLVRISAGLRIPIFMLGGGSNVLVSDSGYDGLVIKNSIKGMELSGRQITCGAGERLGDLIEFAADNDLSGLEFATGIWGTVGGAICGNAGAYGKEMGAVLESAELVDRQGNIRTELAQYFNYSYRWSRLKETGEFATRAKFALEMGNKEAILGKMDEIMAIRREKFPENLQTAGCFFKNVPDNSCEYGKLAAGKLLEEVGAKDLRCGSAAVYQKHANIVINEGCASSADIKRLADLMKLKVKERFGIDLREEVVLLGRF